MSFLSTSQVAALLGVTRWQVTRYISSGRLSAIKLGRDWFIEETELAAFERPRKTGAPKGNQNWKGTRNKPA